MANAGDLTATGSKFNMLLWADSDNSGDGINMVSAHTVNTNGGSLQFGHDETATINGQTVRVGGDVYFSNGGAAQTVSTGGGNVDVFGETIVSNAAGLTIDSAGGNIRFRGLLNSGNQYTWVDKTGDTAHDWDWARADAKNGTAGGASLGDSYLVTITSRLENAIAGLTAGYRGAWIGAYRPSYSSGAWVWANGPESGKQFFTQTTNGSGGTTASGYYSNFGSGEPNGCMSAATCEGVGQFFGTAGQWNDLARTTQFSSTQASIYAVLGYVRETNLAPSPITISSGSGTVTFDGNVGASKALASVNISGTGTATLPAVVTTKGTQTYGGPVALVQNTTLTTTNSDIAFNSTVNSADAAHPKDLTINIVPDTAYYWVNWTSSDANHVYGTITIGGDVIGVTYTNTQGYSFVQTSSSITKYNAGSEVFTNYWSQTQDAHAYDGVTYVSPYVSARVANGPTTANLVALRYAGSQTLTFSQPVENLAFSIMSLNGNGYGFNQDFNIESYTGLNGAASGFYGTGTFTKTSSGSTYNLNGTIGEPHGTIRFANAFNQLTWTSLSNEYWNGFTVGVTGTSATAGKVRFNGVAGGSAALGAVIVNGQMKTTANIADAGSLSVSGLSNLGGNITTAGNQNYQSAVTLSTDATLTTTNNGSVSTTSTIDGAHSLTINTNGTGDTALEGAVGGTTALTGLSVTTDVLSAKAIALANSAALSVTNSGASVISGVISGVATTLTKAGDGTLTLTGANTYTGATTIDAGTLRVLGDTSSAANTTSGYSGSGGALLIEPVSTSFSGAFTFNKPVSGSLSALTIGKSTNTADITLDGAISVAGPISVYGGTVAANASLSTTSASTGDVLISASTGLSGSGNIALADGRTLTVDQAGSTIYNGAISGTDANFVKNGVGDLGLGGASTYGGSTTVNAGVLSLAAADRLPDTTALTVAANGTFSLNGFNETVGSISGSGLIVNGAVVRDGLVLWLDAGNAASYDGTGTAWHDLSGNGYDGTLVGAPTYNAATSLFSFTDNTQYVQLAALPANFLGGTVTGLTVFTVANFGPTADSWERVVDLGNAPSPINTPSNNIILARNGTTNRLGWEYYNGVNAGATYTSIGANTAITNNVKGSYVGTADGSNLRIYRDGVLNTTTASTALPNAIARSSNFIGKSNWAQDDTFRGDIGTLMIYNRALSAAEIAKNHQLLFNRSTATLTTGGSNADTTFSGKIENGVSTLNLVKQGSGTLTLSGSNGYTGSTTVGGGTLKIENDAPASATLTSGFVGSGGALAIVPSGTSFSGAYSFNRPMSGSFSGLLIGKAGNTAAIAMDEAVSIAGDIALIGGDLTLNQQLESTGSHTVTLNASGNVTDGASGYLSADKLLLQGGNVTLDNASNAVGTLAASGVSGLTYLDSDALTVGAVGSTNGISASGAVSVATSNGDLTVAQDVATTNATAAAIVLNAGKSAAAGTAAGGNLIVSGSPAITTGTGGRATLYSGSVSGSTGLADLVGSGSGRFRYGSDEAASNFAAALGSGLYAIYREQPALTLTVADQTVTYGDALPTYTGTVTGGSIANGDSGYRLVGRVDSTGGYIKAGSYTIDAQGLIDLGYAVTQTTGTLTVNRLALAGSISAGSSVYGAALSAGTASFSNVLAGDLLGTASVAVATSGHTSSSGHLQAGSYSGAQSIAALSGADGGNYSFSTVTGDYTVSQLVLSVSGITASNKVYDGNATAAVNTAGAVLGNLVAGDDVTVSAAGAFADKNVGTGKTVTLTSSYGGADLGNYAVAGQAGTTADITPKTLTVVGLAASGKTYDGTAGVSITDWGHVDTGVGSETLVLRASGAAFDDANAGTGKTVTASGYALSDGANGGVASNYRLSAASATTTADIARAALTVTANDDAKFVTQTDASGYNGVQYSGFVHGEDASALGGSLTLSRTNASQNAAGTYRDVLVPAGLTGGNYDISYAAGSYTIVPAEQLLIRFDNASTTYGAAPTYSLASVQYMDSGNAIRTLSGSQSGNTFTYSDGVGGSVSFTVAPQGAATTGAGRLAVGNYALGDSAPTITGSNFSALLFTGNLAVTQKAVAPVVSGVSKVYDGTTGMEGAAIAISGTLSGDAVAVSGNGAFAQKNVGSGVAYTISNLALDGADSANYYLSGGSTFSDNNGVIIARPVTVSGITAGSKTYDGNATAALDMSGVQLANLVVGDNLTISATGAFADKNVGIGKTVAITSTYGGADVGNYVITNQATTAADIARLASVTWIGGAGGNWFDPANWAGGAVPDLSNVANVVIPSGVVVSFDTTGAVSPAQTGPVHIDGLGNSGGLSQSNGELHVGAGGVTLDSYSQSGGILTSVGPITLNSFAQTGGSTATQGNFNVNGDFSQGPNGTVDVGGNANITDTHGGTTLGNLTVAGNANVTSTDGDITQAGGTAVTVAGTTTLSATRGGKPADIVLGNAGNDFGGPVNASGRHITLTDHAGGLTLGTINASGDFNATSTGGPIGQSGGGIVTVGGTTSLDASSAGQPADITLANGGNTFNGPFNATGANILLNAAGGLTFGTVFSQGNVQVAALGDIGQTIGGSFTVSGGGIFQSLNGVIHLDSANNTFGGGLQTLDTSNTDQTHVIAPVPQPVPLPTATDAAPLSASFPTSTGEGGGAAGGPLAQATAGASEGAAGGASAASPASTPTVSESTAGASAGVVVELRTVPTESQSGLITVSLPKGASGSPAGFSFPLPEQVVSTATPEATITASLPNGAPLPTWLRFDPASRSFIASVVPTDALPISVIVTVGNIQTTVVVTEREE